MEELIASLYVDEGMAIIDLHKEKIALAVESFDNGFSPMDQPETKLEEILEKASLFTLEKRYGYLPPGKLNFASFLDERCDVMVYEAYFEWAAVA